MSTSGVCCGTIAGAYACCITLWRVPVCAPRLSRCGRDVLTLEAVAQRQSSKILDVGSRTATRRPAWLPPSLMRNRHVERDQGKCPLRSLAAGVS